jgi:hypothetical protein
MDSSQGSWLDDRLKGRSNPGPCFSKAIADGTLEHPTVHQAWPLLGDTTVDPSKPGSRKKSDAVLIGISNLNSERCAHKDSS